MQLIEQSEIRRSFVNSSRSRAAAVTFPRPWPPERLEDRDFLGWSDPKAPRRGYLVVDAGRYERVVAVELRLPPGTATGRQTMCDWCQTSDAPGGARLVVAQRAGARGRAGDTVGVYVCEDFACSQRARQPLKPHQISVSGRGDQRIPELLERVHSFVDRVLQVD
ncbi:FBP domain-containing protein [Aeromicrobium sp. CTD01-1L150]|uniref:FBP domain-containing protein n=1 Tax=Aeromicrobium sp. CTD01-1L150 TaxID=3341830 RepID=UPI0035BEE97E